MKQQIVLLRSAKAVGRASDVLAAINASFSAQGLNANLQAYERETVIQGLVRDTLEDVVLEDDGLSDEADEVIAALVAEREPKLQQNEEQVSSHWTNGMM